MESKGFSVMYIEVYEEMNDFINNCQWLGMKEWSLLQELNLCKLLLIQRIELIAYFVGVFQFFGDLEESFIGSKGC